MSVGIESYAIIEFEHSRPGGRSTFGVMAYSEPHHVPLGIDAHWTTREAAERALSNYTQGRCEHGRTTEREHRLAWERKGSAWAHEA